MRYYFTFLLIVLTTVLSAQSKVATYYYKNKEYNVYPFRISNGPEIPAVGYPIPDGDYIVFKQYDFYTDYKKKEIKLLDSTKINAIISIKNNKVEGEATFFNYSSGLFKTKQYIYLTANYKNGILSGTMRKYDYETLTSTEEYENGLLNGMRKEYFSNGKIYSIEKYKNGEKVDTSTFFYSNGQIREIFDQGADDQLINPSPYYSIISKYHSAASRKINKIDNYNYNTNPVKSFYKHYTLSGKMTISIKIDSNNILPIDSFYKYDGKTKCFVTLIPDGYIVECLPDKKGKWWHEEKTESKSESLKTTTKYYSRRKGLLSVNEKTTYQKKNTNSLGKQPILMEATIWHNYKTGKGYSDSSSYIPFFDLHINKYTQYIYSSNKEIDNFEFDYIIDTLNNSITKLEIDSLNKVSIKTKKETFYNKDGSYIADTIEKNPFIKWNYLFPDEELIGLTGKQNFKSEIESHKNYETDSTGNKYKSKSNVLTTASQAIYYKNAPYNGKININTNQVIKYNKKKKSLFIDSGFFLEGNEWMFDAAEGTLLNNKLIGEYNFIANSVIYENIDKLKKFNTLFAFYSHEKPLYGEYYSLKYENGKANGSLVQYLVTDTVERYSKKGNLLPTRKQDCVIYKETICNFKNDEIDGPLYRFDRFGDTILNTNFSAGILNGSFVKKSGKSPIYIGKALNGKLSGPLYIYKNGQKTLEANFIGNQLNGILSRYNNGFGQKYLELHAKLDFIFRKTLYFPNGKIKENIQMSDTSKVSMNSRFLSSETLFENKIKIRRSLNEAYDANYVTYYESGDTLSYGRVIDNKPVGVWRFYSSSKTLINEVVFKDSLLWYAANDSSKVKSIGTITSYYNNGRIRCTGYLTKFSMSYNCAEHQDMTNFDIYYKDFYDLSGKQTCANGTGEFIVYNEKGIKTTEAKVANYRRTGNWKYFDENVKLNEIGIFKNDLKDGVWYKGDLEGLNFEDNACFDANNEDAQKAYEYSKKKLRFYIITYLNGKKVKEKSIESDMNKERDYSKRYY